MTLVLRYSARSDRGLVRQNNQDAVYAGPRLLALADGMGGHAAGEVASSLVISALAPLDEDDPGDDLLGHLRDATFQGNAAITRHVAEAPDLEGMGTTLTAILFAGSRLGLVHVGDSRCYQLRNGEFTQITKDDTFVQSLIDEGRITEEEAHTHPQRSLLLRAITGQEVEPSLTMREARAGDRYLLCSDGLSGPVSDETLAHTLAEYSDPRECADRLIELALRGGGPDNITCIVADVVDVDYGDVAPIVGGAAGDGSDDHRPGPDTAAGRASATTLPRVAPRRTAEQPAAEERRRRPTRRIVITAVVAVVVVVAAVLLARTWVMQQYYVGASADHVAIYQGVRGSVLGIPLQRVSETSDIALSDLPEDYRSRVQDGIVASDGMPSAQSTLQVLRDKRLPVCPAPTTPVVPPADPNGTAAQPPAAPTTTPPAAPPSGAAVVPEQPVAPDTPLQSETPVPGQTCRPAS
ncbi:protein serine/threonine phosphatase [Pseudonocardia dioxanivorans CB1190]|jgi:protein phosphatase|uniref:Serine/threonine protein phosphatase PstP n=1 Tax=Pseudonocardia dioxanivorans (strain ATCC 55486 / DSM 44775 / JCM 13855 / CB1190) TaxID=675635 RepID=F4CQF7_PSEUX|nr:PP2C family serine/threonine-protein phosphatase [Pseudonocardia dioxanivorans]AEA22395.1 protein serine/threonine phosphatase [Pseudonocardia dioxanivorans CB1190]